MTDIKAQILEAYKQIISQTKNVPVTADFIDYGIDRHKIRTHFGNLSKLHQHFRDNFGDVFDDNVAHEDVIFNHKKLDGLSEQLRGKKVFIITTAVASKSVDENLYKSIKNYLDRRDGKLIVLPCADIASRQADSQIGFVVDPLLRDEFFVVKEFRLNDKLFVSDISVSAKQILPTTGLGRIGQTNGSYIFASPKQMLEFVATAAKEPYPKAIMTTGAITKPNYNHDKWMSRRTSYIAEHDHVMGGIIVEIEDEKYFHFRQFQSNVNGEFVDLGKRYFPDGTVEDVVTHLYAGDWHAGATDPVAVNALINLSGEIEISDLMVGDFFNGYSISHHHMQKPGKRAEKALHGTDSLLQEIRQCGDDINLIHRMIISGNLVLLRGNHDEVLERYIESGNYTKDYANQYIALKLAVSQLEGKDVLREAFLEYGNIDEPERIVWLDRDDEFKIGDVECGQHGDLGPNGATASLPGLEKAYGNCVVGHSHSGAIMRGVFRVGTMTKLSLDYNKGPSSWTHTCCLVYEDGSRQLINVVNGKFHIDK